MKRSLKVALNLMLVTSIGFQCPAYGMMTDWMKSISPAFMAIAGGATVVGAIAARWATSKLQNPSTQEINTGWAAIIPFLENILKLDAQQLKTMSLNNDGTLRPKTDENELSAWNKLQKEAVNILITTTTNSKERAEYDKLISQFFKHLGTNNKESAQDTLNQIKTKLTLPTTSLTETITPEELKQTEAQLAVSQGEEGLFEGLEIKTPEEQKAAAQKAAQGLIQKTDKMRSQQQQDAALKRTLTTLTNALNSLSKTLKGA